ncbi:ribbon-helix-helix protein, CopG family [Nostoc sp.]|uniref:ribbon-helix-helix protein, CopG family n=1 Tax=Nostoc sp. TaxID=1180 RepID=UPI0035930FE2
MNNQKRKKTSLPVYLDQFERERLEEIANLWGTSLSTTIKRLIREQPIYPKGNR